MSLISVYLSAKTHVFRNEHFFRNTETGKLGKVYSELGYLNNDFLKYFENYQYKERSYLIFQSLKKNIHHAGTGMSFLHVHSLYAHMIRTKTFSYKSIEVYYTGEYFNR